jgi:hypothetical protein
MMTKANSYANLDVTPLLGSNEGRVAQARRQSQAVSLTIWMHAAGYIKENHYILTVVLVFILSGMLAVLLGD